MVIPRIDTRQALGAQHVDQSISQTNPRVWRQPPAVFHSFRHNMKDALIAGGVNQDIRDALLGWAQTGSGRFYGFNEIVRHWTIGSQKLLNAPNDPLT